MSSFCFDSTVDLSCVAVSQHVFGLGPDSLSSLIQREKVEALVVGLPFTSGSCRDQLIFFNIRRRVVSVFFFFCFFLPPHVFVSGAGEDESCTQVRRFVTRLHQQQVTDKPIFFWNEAGTSQVRTILYYQPICLPDFSDCFCPLPSASILLITSTPICVCLFDLIYFFSA